MRGRIQIPGGYGVPEEQGKFKTTEAGFLRLGMGRVPVFVSNPILANTNPQQQIAPDRWGRVGPLGDSMPGSGLIVNYLEPIALRLSQTQPVNGVQGSGLAGDRNAAASYDPGGFGYGGGGGAAPEGSSASRNTGRGGNSGGSSAPGSGSGDSGGSGIMSMCGSGRPCGLKQTGGVG